MFKRVQGYLDGVHDGRVYGWASDGTSEPVAVVAYCGKRPVGAGLADGFRPDVTATRPDGRCGFSFPVHDFDDSIAVVAGRVRLPRATGFTFEADAPSRSRFVTRLPSHHNAVECFAGGWASDLSAILPHAEKGEAALFDDPRMEFAADVFGRDGRLDGMRVLELGPLEGAHTHMLEQRGAEILAIESNRDAYLKCLIVKEIAGMKSRFLLGDAGEFLKTTKERFDLVVACGVLYHLSDPLTVIENIARVTDRCFVWSHVFDEKQYDGPPRVRSADPRFPDIALWYASYGESVHLARFWGGNRDQAAWMRADDMVSFFGRCGLKLIARQPQSASAPLASITFCAARV